MAKEFDPNTMSLPSGTRLGPYEILAAIGAGGMGEVYRSYDARLNRAVAIKILPAAFAEDVDRLRRFEQEARAAGSLNHPNIVVVYDLGRSGNIWYVVTELLEGETLRSRLGSSPLPSRKAAEYATQTARGLAAAHGKGIIHRDIKPENLFLTVDGFVKILDFGLAKVAAPRSGDKANSPTVSLGTDPGVVMGTAGYMSPEQVLGTAIDHRSDIFSLGVVTYEMLAGKRPFERNSSIETMNAILNEDPPELPVTAPPALERIVRRCIEKKSDERFESARDLAFALESISGSGSSREKPVESAPSRKWVAWLAAAVILVLVALAGAYLLGARSAYTEPPSFHRLTFRRGVIIGANFANEGKTIIYSAAWDGKPYEVFSTQENSPESRPLGIANAFPVSVSRNGEMALILSPIVRLWETPGILARAPVAGGAPREVADNILTADWSPDGTQLAVVRGTATSQAVEYPLGKMLYETTGFVGGVKVSPKGGLVAFADEPLAGDNSGYIRIVDQAGKTKAVSRKWNNIQGLHWARKGEEIWFCASRQGVMTDLYAMDLQGRERTIARLPGMFFLWDVSADDRALIGQYNFSYSAVFRGAAMGQETDLYWHDESTLGDISPDGRQVLFSEEGDASTRDFVAYVRRTDGSPPVRLGEGWATAFSPDGKWAMVNPKGEPPQLVAFPLRVGNPHPLTADSIRHLAGRWLPDGNRIVFVGVESGGRPRYYVQDTLQSPPRPISEENVEFDRNTDDIVISPDGRSVAASTRDRGVQILAVEGGESKPVPSLDSTFTPVAWCRDGSLLAYRSGEIPARMVRVNLLTGQKKPWKDLAPAERTGLYQLQPIRVSPDCETYGYSAQYLGTTLFVMSGIQ